MLDIFNFKEYLILDEAAALLFETSKYIDPLTNKNWRSTDKWRQLAAIVKQESSKEDPTKPNRIWITFSDVSRLGLPQNVSSGKTTPYGVFAYPATFVLEKSGNFTFYGSNRPYIIVFKVKGTMAEIGEKRNDASKVDRFSKEMKSDLLKSVNGTIYNHVKKVQIELHDFLTKWLSRSTLHWDYAYTRRDVRDLAGHVLDNAFQKIAHESSLQKISEQNMFNVEEAREESYNSAKNNLKDVLDNLNVPSAYGTNINNRYIDIHDDLSAELSPEFKEYIKNTKDDFPNAKDIDLDGRKSFDWLLAFDHKTFNNYYNKIYVKDFQNARPDNKESIYNSPYLNKLFNILAMKAKKMFDSYDVKPISQMNYPMKPELNMLAGQYGANIDNAIKNVMNGSVPVLNGRQFIYRVAREMAREASTKMETKWQAIWSKMLRQLGWDHAVDTKYSGSIHSSEPTQGVFMDPTKIEQIGLILNKSHVGHEDMSQRPNLTHKTSWKSLKDSNKLRSGQHSRTAGPQIMRKGPMAGGYTTPSLLGNANSPSIMGKTAAQRTLISLNVRLGQFARMFSSREENDPQFALHAEELLVMLVKLIKTAKNVKDSMSSADKDWSLIKQMDNELAKINFEIKKLKMSSMSVSVRQAINNIIGMTEKGAQGVETSHFSRPFWKQAGFQKQFPKPVSVNGGAALKIFKAPSDDGFYIDSAKLGEYNDHTDKDKYVYFGPFASLTNAVTVCVLIMEKHWKFYWNEIPYWDTIDIKDKKSEGDCIFLPPEAIVLNSNIDQVELVSVRDNIQKEVEETGWA